jgi:hypothetical protein
MQASNCLATQTCEVTSPRHLLFIHSKIIDVAVDVVCDNMQTHQHDSELHTQQHDDKLSVRHCQDSRALQAADSMMSHPVRGRNDCHDVMHWMTAWRLVGVSAETLAAAGHKVHNLTQRIQSFPHAPTAQGVHRALSHCGISIISSICCSRAE